MTGERRLRRGGPATGILALLTLLLLTAGACTGRAGGGGASASREGASPAPGAGGTLRPRLLLIGADGMDWEVLGPLIARGECPNLAALAASGARGGLLSPHPRISPMLWTSMLTGRYPEDHGILDFFMPGAEGEGPVPVRSTARRAKAIWNILDARGLRSGVVGFWATWPAEPIAGVVVSEAFAPSLFEEETPRERVVYPDQWRERIEDARDAPPNLDAMMVAFVGAAGLEVQGPGLEGSAAKIEQDPVRHLRKMLRSTMAFHRASMAVAEGGDVDALFVYHQLIDEVCHRFMHLAPPPRPGIDPALVAQYGGAVEAAYRLEDRLVGELVKKVPEDAYVMVVSDHGFLSGARRLAGDPSDFAGEAASWHREEAVVILRGPGIPAGATLRGTIYDVTPTLLALLGLPVAKDMPGRPLLGGDPERVLESYGAPAPAGEAAPADAAGTSDAQLAELRALGYVAGGAHDADLSASGLLNLGVSLSQRGRHREAQHAFRDALAVAPDSVVVRYNLAASLEEHGEPERAYPLLIDLCGRDERIPMGALARLGEAVGKPGAPDTAALEAALEERPERYRDWEWHYARACLARERRDLPAARESLVRCLERAPMIGQPVMELVKLTPAGERPAVRSLCLAAIRTLPSPPVTAWLAPALREEHEEELAEAVEARLHELSP